MSSCDRANWNWGLIASNSMWELGGGLGTSCVGRGGGVAYVGTWRLFGNLS